MSEKIYRVQMNKHGMPNFSTAVEVADRPQGGRVMYNDFIVKVHRYWEEDNGSRGWDGWYFSKVYAIDGNEFLVYDDGGMSAYNGEEDFCETGFNWVDFTATMDRCGENGRQPIVEPLASFNIADYLADRKTEQTEREGE